MKKTLISIVSGSSSGKTQFGEHLQSVVPGIQYLNWADFKLKSNGKSNPTEQEAFADLFTQASKHDVVIIDNAPISSGAKNIYEHFENKIVVLEDTVSNKAMDRCFMATRGMKANLYQTYKGKYYTPEARYRAEKLAALKPTYVRATWFMSNECLAGDVQRLLRSFK